MNKDKDKEMRIANDAMEKTIEPRAVATAKQENDIITEYGWVNTGVRASDEIRYLYLNVRGFSVAEMTAFLEKVQAGEVTRETIRTMLKKDSDLTDTLAENAVPRFGLIKSNA